MPHAFFSKPVRTIEQAVADIVAEAVRRKDWQMYARALRLEAYGRDRKVTRS